MREKLSELLKSTPDVWMSDKSSEMLADHLIANGVTVLPQKVGDTIFEADPEHGAVKHEVYEICVVYKTTATDDKGNEWDDFYTSDDIDTAYKTRDEAEASLPQPPKEG